jgi:hypothetical protein
VSTARPDGSVPGTWTLRSPRLIGSACHLRSVTVVFPSRELMYPPLNHCLTTEQLFYLRMVQTPCINCVPFLVSKISLGNPHQLSLHPENHEISLTTCNHSISLDTGFTKYHSRLISQIITRHGITKYQSNMTSSIITRGWRTRNHVAKGS